VVASAFTNPDHVAVVVHNYRWRLSLANVEPQYDTLEQRLFAMPVITVPTITIAGDFDGPAIDGTSYRNKFSGKYSHRILAGVSPPAGEWRYWPTRGEGPPDHRPLTTPSRFIW